MATLNEAVPGETSGALFRALRSAGVEAKFDPVNSRIDTLQRVIWPLVVLLASTVFGLPYQVLTS